VVAKGKGVLTTFWLSPQAKRAASVTESEAAANDWPSPQIDVLAQSALSLSKISKKIKEKAKAEQCAKHERLVDWMLELFLGMIRPIVARQVAMKLESTPLSIPEKQLGEIALDELVETIQLPEFNASAVGANVNMVEVPNNIVRALRQYISIVSTRVRFERHASLASARISNEISTTSSDCFRLQRQPIPQFRARMSRNHERQ